MKGFNEFDENEWQGRNFHQQKGNERLAYLTIILFIFFIFTVVIVECFLKE